MKKAAIIFGALVLLGVVLFHNDFPELFMSKAEIEEQEDEARLQKAIQKYKLPVNSDWSDVLCAQADERKQQRLLKRAKELGLPAGSTWDDVRLHESIKEYDLSTDATMEDVQKARAERKEKKKQERMENFIRIKSKMLGLPNDLPSEKLLAKIRQKALQLENERHAKMVKRIQTTDQKDLCGVWEGDSFRMSMKKKAFYEPWTNWDVARAYRKGVRGPRQGGTQHRSSSAGF